MKPSWLLAYPYRYEVAGVHAAPTAVIELDIIDAYAACTEGLPTVWIGIEPGAPFLNNTATAQSGVNNHVAGLKRLANYTGTIQESKVNTSVR